MRVWWWRQCLAAPDPNDGVVPAGHEVAEWSGVHFAVELGGQVERPGVARVHRQQPSANEHADS